MHGKLKFDTEAYLSFLFSEILKLVWYLYNDYERNIGELIYELEFKISVVSTTNNVNVGFFRIGGTV